MSSIHVVIPDAAAVKLTELAREQFRAPRQQAAALLVEAIERAAHDTGQASRQRVQVAAGRSRVEPDDGD